MTFTITPQPDNVPPRVRIDVNSDDSSKPFTALTIKRDGKSLREQPFVGSSAAVLFDYEAPFGVPVSYSAAGTVATTTPVLVENWTSLSGWTTTSGTPSVSGGHLAGGSVSRSLSLPTLGRVVSQGLRGSAGSQPATLVIGQLALKLSSSATSSVQMGSGPAIAVAGLNAPFQLTWDSSQVTITTSLGTTNVVGNIAVVSSVAAGTIGTGNSVEPFTISSLVGAPFTASSSTTLNVTDAWLIHPSKPSLSCKIDSGPGAPGTRFIEASSGESKSSQAVSTVHRPVGRRRAVVITSGPRQADEWTLVLESDTIAAKNDLRALVDDQTPLLLRSSASVNRDLPDDWYSVGDVTVTRVEVPVITEASLMTLPLTPVDEPIVRVGALWTAGDVLAQFATAQDVMDYFDDALALLAGPQS